MKNHIAEKIDLCTIFRKIYRYINDYDGNKYLTLIPSNEER